MIRIIPDSYTEYYSGKTIIPASLPNIEGKMGWSAGGELGKVYSLSDAKTARDIFKSGSLLRALEESFNAGASLIYAQRIGPAGFAEIVLNDASAAPSVKIIAAEPGSYANAYEVDLTEDGADVILSLLDGNSDDEINISAASLAALVEAINTSQSLVRAEILGSQLPAAISSTLLTGGTDGKILSNGDYIGGLELFESQPEINWVHCVGADTPALWVAITTHCDYMINENLSERFAILDPPRFIPLIAGKPTLNEIQDYVDLLCGMTATFSNRNAIIVAGEGVFMGSDGSEYSNTLTATISGILASNPLQKSLIGENLSTVIRLIPEFSPAQQAQFIGAKLNFGRLEPGVGYIAGHSLTLAPLGDTYNRIEKLRAIYYAGKQTRAAAFPHLGKPNDSGGQGLTLLEADLRRPLDLMVKNGQIDNYDILVESDETMRALGEVQVSLSVNSMKAMEIILSKITLD